MRRRPAALLLVAMTAMPALAEGQGACPVFEAACGCVPGEPAMVAVRDGLITIEVDTRPALAAARTEPPLAIARTGVQEFSTQCHCRPGEPARILFQKGWSAVVRPPDEEPGLAWTLARIGDGCIAPTMIE